MPYIFQVLLSGLVHKYDFAEKLTAKKIVKKETFRFTSRFPTTEKIQEVVEVASSKAPRRAVD